MGIGTSDGEYYESDLQHAVAPYIGMPGQDSIPAKTMTEPEQAQDARDAAAKRVQRSVGGKPRTEEVPNSWGNLVTNIQKRFGAAGESLDNLVIYPPGTRRTDFTDSAGPEPNAPLYEAAAQAAMLTLGNRASPFTRPKTPVPHGWDQVEASPLTPSKITTQDYLDILEGFKNPHVPKPVSLEQVPFEHDAIYSNVEHSVKALWEKFNKAEADGDVGGAIRVLEEARRRAPPPEVKIPPEAAALGYDTPAYRGVKREPRQNPTYTDNGQGLNEMYSAKHPSLAEMYASGAYENYRPQIQPLLLNTKNYLVHDAEGATWLDVNTKLIQQAKEEGKQGIVIHNVIDEPGTSMKNQPGTLPPQTVFITLDTKTARSRFAKFKDASVNDLLASGVAIALPPAIANHIMNNKE